MSAPIPMSTATQLRAPSGPEIYPTLESQVSHRGWSRITANATFSSPVGAPEVADRTWSSPPRPRYRALGRLPSGFPACPSTSAACSRNVQCNGPGHVRSMAAPDLLTAGRGHTSVLAWERKRGNLAKTLPSDVYVRHMRCRCQHVCVKCHRNIGSFRAKKHV